MNDHIVAYACQLGNEHTIPGEDVRILKTGDGSFLAVCDCSAEPLAECHERPHESEKPFSYIDGRKIPPADWLSLERLADAWYDVDPEAEPAGYSGTRRDRRQQFADTMADRAGSVGKGGDLVFDSAAEQRRHEQAREVACPDCGAATGRKCQRPSGHRVRRSHSDRLAAARTTGVLSGIAADSGQTQTTDSSSPRQVHLDAF